MTQKAGENHRRISVLGSCYSLLTREEIERRILDDALSGRSGYVCVSNVHTTMTGYFEPDYQEITNSSAYSVPDGMPLVWAMRSLGGRGQDRVRGPSLMRALLDQGRKQGLKHYLYGGSPKALEALGKVIEKEYPGALIVGAESPPFRPLAAISEQEWQDTADRIHRSGAHILWVGLGAPKQERWMWMQRSNLRVMQLGVGAAFDLIPGLVPEAPEGLQRFGLEWLYRFYREPRRLWRRYLFNNPAFLFLWGLQLVQAKLFRRSYLCESKSS